MAVYNTYEARMIVRWMDDSAQGTAVTNCPQCGATADTGSIFCAKCGTPLRAPGPLIPPGVQAPAKRKWISVKWTLVAIVLLFGYFAWQCGSGMSAGARLSDDAVRHFHSQLDSQRYGEIMDESDEGFRHSGSRDEILKFLSGVHSKLGASRGFTRTNIVVNATTNGTFIRVSYKSTFDQGDAAESFTWRKTGDGLKLFNYQVNSNVFVTR
jgi:hypothetical protein